jgi:hypothetical protein
MSIIEVPLDNFKKSKPNALRLTTKKISRTNLLNIILFGVSIGFGLVTYWVSSSVIWAFVVPILVFGGVKLAILVYEIMKLDFRI